MSRPRTLARLLAAPVALGAGALVALATASPASAHVTISPSAGAAGSYTVLTVSVPHGCDGEPTTRIAVSIPEQIPAVTPTRNPLWRVATTMVKLDQPITDAHGNQITERVGKVVYTAKTPLPDGYRDAFELSLQLPSDAAGQTLAFPTIQTCAKGRTAWVEVAASGQSATDLEHPAPTVTVEAAQPDQPEGSEGSDAEADGSSASSEPAATATSGADGESGSDGGGVAGWLGVALGAIGAALGGTALARSHRSA